MTYLPQQRVSRRAMLGSLAGSAVGLALLHADPVAALASSTIHNTSTTYMRGQTLYTYKGMRFFTQSVDWSPDGSQIVSTGTGLDDPGEVARVWDALTGNHVVTYTGDGGVDGYGVSKGEWAPDGTRIASAVGRLGKIWNPVNGQTLTTYTGHAPTVQWLPAVEWAPDGQRVASSGAALPRQDFDHSIHIWDPVTGAHLLTYSGHTLDANALSWSPDGRSIASGNGGSFSDTDFAIHVWDTQTGQRLLIYPGHTGPVQSVAWSPDGGRVASASADGTVHIWNPLTGKGYLTYRGHLSGVSSVDWSPDGTLIASGSGDRSVQIWSPESPKTLYYYYGNGAYAPVVDVAWSPNGRLIADGTATDFVPTQSQVLVWVGR